MTYPNLRYRVPSRYPDLTYAHMIALPTGEPCELVRPEYFGYISWFGIPLPDYSFALEPEVRERKLDEILEKLKNGVQSIQNSSVFRDFLLTMAKFHDYSIGNTILIMLQKRDATQVAGFNTWKDLGRFVKAGEKGIAILAPCFGTVGEAHWFREDTEWTIRRSGDRFEIYLLRANGVETVPQRLEHTAPNRAKAEIFLRGQGAVRSDERTASPTYFKVVYVFDVAQTTGKELPRVEVPVLSGAANEDLFNRVLLLDKNQGVDVSFEPRPSQDPEVKGLYIGKSIWVRPEEARAQQLKTLIHENGHYYTETVFGIPRSDAETIAESVAFVVGAHFGFDTGTRSFPYVAIWSQDKNVLERNLASIRNISSRMIDGIESINAPTSYLKEEKEPWQMTKGEFSRKSLRDAFPEGTAGDKPFEELTDQQAIATADAYFLKPTGVHDHEYFIRQALSKGKPVPHEVLAEYPELQRSSYLKEEKEPRHTTMDDRFTIDCSYCGFLVSERTLAEALDTAKSRSLKHNTPEEKITVYDRLAQRGACQIYDVDGHCLKTKPFNEVPVSQLKESAGESIARELGMKYDGIQPGFGVLPDMMQFTDRVETGTTFYANSLEDARERLAEKRELFRSHKPLESQIDRELSAKLTGNLVQEFKTQKYQKGL